MNENVCKHRRYDSKRIFTQILGIYRPFVFTVPDTTLNSFR
jgi:hypothetical protein